MKKIIDFTLEQMLKNDEIGTVEMLRGVITDIISEFGDITDDTRKLYNKKPDGEYDVKISISTIRNYLKPYNYVVRKDENECIVKCIDFPEYVIIRNELDKNKNQGNLDTKNNDNGLSEKEKMAVEIFRKSTEYREQSCINIRVANSVKERLENIYSTYDAFTKQQIISYLLDVAITQLENTEN
ncbi:hypothetical protein [Anaerocolumna aminovalerica]|uniref:hypothetical protein n=1 Tax=Anaerocolumna aminovalerica TaxID=1527 RepID=UPI00248BF1E1|nr:hypothetical protein [Anaerocolumna aminovalerica]